MVHHINIHFTNQSCFATSIKEIDETHSINQHSERMNPMTYVNANVACATSIPAVRPLLPWAKLQFAVAAYRQRQTLRRLDANALNDIGITRAQAEREASRKLWDVPANWRQ
jgi:uncharacterized protein YjiS (DUF1127 family)